MKPLEETFKKLPPEKRDELFKRLWELRPDDWEDNPSWISEAYNKLENKDETM